MKPLAGLIAAPFTPFNDRGALNLDKIETLARLYDKNGVAGAFICGSTGEGVALTVEEKKQVAQKWGEVKGDNLKTVLMVGGTCLPEMQALVEHAQAQGIDAISALCPYYFRPANVERLVGFCRQVAMVTPDLPFYYYHIPALTGGDFSMKQFLQLAEEAIPNLAGIKYTHSNLMDFQQCVGFNGGRYTLLWGMDEALLSGLVLGAAGAVGSTYNYAAPLYHQIIQAFEDNDMEAARRLQQKAVEMVEILVKYGGSSAGKAFMKLIGVDCGWFRQPLFSLEAEQLKAMEKELVAIGFFDFCSEL